MYSLPKYNLCKTEKSSKNAKKCVTNHNFHHLYIEAFMKESDSNGLLKITNNFKLY